jgi:DNA (cytosine-5)-methyltransferase 1
LIVDLHDFEIYRSPNVGKEGRWFELISLHHMEVPNPKRLCFHGFLCLGNVKHYVQSIPIQDLSIEGYGDDIDSGVICYIRSELANRDTTYDIWYRLNKPTIEYQRYHEPFLWVARLGKYVIDYLESSSSRSVGLEDFRKQFCSWLLDRYSEDANFRKWHNAFRDQVDFRVGVNAYIDYLYLQAHNLPNSQQLLAHPLWRECMARGLTQVEAQNEVEKHTLATPDVYSLFRDMYFGENLRARSPIQRVKARQADRKRNLGFSGGPFSTSFTEPPSSSCRKYGMSPIRVGDVVAMNPDKNDLQHWRNADWEWLAYVQDVAQRPDGTQKLFVLWLYRPRETNIFKAKYGLHNELFMSDNCNCRAGELLSTHVNGRYDIDWSPKTVSTTRFFIRQTYITEDSAFVSLAEDHKTCSHRKKIPMPSDKYERGDTVYLERLLHRHKILDPVIVWSIDNTSDTVTIRRLSRLELDCADLAVAAGRKDISPNELVLTDEYEVVKSSRINRRCFVRFVSKTSTLSGFIPFPYDRHGAGDFWFLAMEVIKRKGMQYLDFLSRHPRCFREGPDMVAKSQMLKGLSLFSGGGSLDRGLEECGAVDFRTVVDISAPAIHTQRANARNPDQMRFYCGPVDDFFAAALSERDPGLVTQVGKVEIIAAGAPCPGTHSDLFNNGLLTVHRLLKTTAGFRECFLAETCLAYNYFLFLCRSLSTTVRHIGECSQYGLHSERA